MVAYRQFGMVLSTLDLDSFFVDSYKSVLRAIILHYIQYNLITY